MKKQDLLQFWRDIEIFDLPELSKDASLIDADSILPWTYKLKEPRKHFTWRYTLLFGKIDKKHVLEHITTLLKADKPGDWEEPIQGFSCFSAVILDEEGRPKQDSYVLPSYIVGINLLEKNASLSSVPCHLVEIKDAFLERYNIPEISSDEDSPIKGDIVTWKHLQREVEYLKQITSWWKDEIKIFLLTEEVPKDSEPNPGFMNSFYLDDLNYLSGVEEKELSTTLSNYLQLQPSTSTRKDLIRDKQFLFNSIDPEEMTAGRWPSKIENGLYAAQAGAVNSIFSDLRNKEGIQGINGPPGTGKTTLLLDVIAEIVVERAKIISELGCYALFQKGHKKIEKESGFTLYTYNLNLALSKNFGIVVASNNNAAVENISKELPLKSKIDLASFPEADYFSECSMKLIDAESWGILAAALGNARNRSNFRKSFWQPEKTEGVIGFHDLLYSVYKDSNSDETDAHCASFGKQNIHFKSLIKEFETFKKTAGSFHKLLPAFIENRQQEENLQMELIKIEANLSKLNSEKKELHKIEDHVKRNQEAAQALMRLHTQRKPAFFFFKKLFNCGSFKEWNREAANIISNLKSVNIELDRLIQQLNANHNETEKLLSRKNECNSTMTKLISFFAKYQSIRNELIEKYEIDDKNLFDIEFYQKDISDVHLLNPYHSKKIAKLRSDVFISALKLHRDAILSNAKNIKNNLNAYFEMTSGRVQVNADIAQNLWDTFFLCVPVVSTTLASASRLFPNISKQQIGWLLIDEAGQATPQSAVGLIHRAKRCVIVGDPLQVEPVVTLPEKLVLKLRDEHNVSVDWSPYRVSVQQLADRISQLGTYMRIGNVDENIWTGFPLRAHRRCDEPMFSIANKIAYGDQMTKAISSNSHETFIGASCWFDINTQPTLINRHVVKEEIELLKDKIEELRNSYNGNIYVISPFRSIASYCEDTFRTDNKISCGTIHRFQGREADIVFLILGSDPKSVGAREWASQKPNMLNVALTRAKKRFYVIGNKKLWASCNYFNIMAKSLNEKKTEEIFLSKS